MKGQKQKEDRNSDRAEERHEASEDRRLDPLKKDNAAYKQK